MSKLTNKEAVELYNLLNSINTPKGSHLEYATMKTIRKMKDFIAAYNEKIKEIDDDHVATYKDENGVEIRMTKKLERTRTDADGTSVKEEYEVPVYTKEGEKKRTRARLDFVNSAAIVPFEIHQTSDHATLDTYQRIALSDLGFIKDYSEDEELLK